MRPTAVTTSMMFTGPPPSPHSILPDDDLTAGSGAQLPDLPDVNNPNEQEEAVYLRNELQAHGLAQFFTVLWALGVRGTYKTLSA